ncbi:unnamed protein product, partial [Scytosiphon promiscuus]
ASEAGQLQLQHTARSRADGNRSRRVLSLLVARDAMPRRERQSVLLPRRFILVAATAAAAAATTTPTVESWTPGTGRSSSGATTTSTATSEQASPSYLPIPAEHADAVSTPARRRAWGVAIPRSLISGGRRRGPGRYPGEGATGTEFAPLWVRARGGAAGKRAAGGKRLSQLSEEAEAAENGAGIEEEAQGPEEEEEAEEVDDGEVEDHDEDSGAEQKAEGVGGGSTAPAAAGGGAAVEEASVLEMLDLKTVLPLAIKQGAFFLMARWLGKNLSPEVESQVRAARVIYTAYLIFSQALCMYIRYLIWKRDDNAEIAVPPPAQLKGLMQEAG